MALTLGVNQAHFEGGLIYTSKVPLTQEGRASNRFLSLGHLFLISGKTTESNIGVNILTFDTFPGSNLDSSCYKCSTKLLSFKQKDLIMNVKFLVQNMASLCWS